VIAALTLPAALRIKEPGKHVLGGRGGAAPGRHPEPPQAGVRRAARHLVPGQPPRASPTLLSPASLQRGFQPAFVRQIVDEHISGKATIRCSFGGWWCSRSGISSNGTAAGNRFTVRTRASPEPAIPR
jgi:hypothetical protein